MLAIAIAIATTEAATAAQPSELTTDLVKLLLLADGSNRIDVHVLDVAGPQPLAAEIGHQSIGTAVVQHPLNLSGQIFTQLALVGEPHQLIVRHRRPEKIREPRRQCVFVDEWVFLIVGGWRRVLGSEQEPRRRQDGHHRIRNAGLERLARLVVGRLGDGDQSCQSLLVRRPAVCPLGERGNDFARIGIALLGIFRRRPFREEPPVFPILDAVLHFERAANDDRADSIIHRIDSLVLSRQRLHLELELPLTLAQVGLEFVMPALAIGPAIFLFVQFLAVGCECHAAAAGVELEVAVELDIEDDFVLSFFLPLERTCDGGRLVVAESLAAHIVILAAEPLAVETLLGHDERLARHGLFHDLFGRLQIFLHQQRRQGQHVANVVEAVTRIVGRKVLGRVVIDARQIADRIAILDTVEPAERHPAGIGIGRVDVEGIELDPIEKLAPLLFIGPLLALGRHHAGTHVLQHGRPELDVADQRLVGLELVQRAVALAGPVAVAAVAIRLEDRLDVLRETAPRRCFLRRSTRNWGWSMQSSKPAPTNWRSAQRRAIFEAIRFSHCWGAPCVALSACPGGKRADVGWLTLHCSDLPPGCHQHFRQAGSLVQRRVFLEGADT